MRNAVVIATQGIMLWTDPFAKVEIEFYMLNFIYKIT